MTERRTVPDSNTYPAGSWSESLDHFIVWLQAERQALPADLRSPARIYFYDEHGDGDIDIAITYDRLETDEELAERLRSEEREAEISRLRAEAMMKDNELRNEYRRKIELQALDRLLGLYPDYAKGKLRVL